MTDRLVIELPDAGDVWPAAEDLAVQPPEKLALVSVQLEGRRIGAAELVACWRFIFGGAA